MVERQLPKLDTRVRFPSPAYISATTGRTPNGAILDAKTFGNRIRGEWPSDYRLPLIALGNWDVCPKRGTGVPQALRSGNASAPRKWLVIGGPERVIGHV